MKYLRWIGLMSSLLIVGAVGDLMAPVSSEALTVKIGNATVNISTTSAACSTGYTLCSFIAPGTYDGWIVGNVNDSTNKARVMIADFADANKLDLLKVTGITFTPIVTTGTQITTVVVTHTYSVGQPIGNYSWGAGFSGYFDPPGTGNIVGDRLQETGSGNFAGSITSLGSLDTGVLATPSGPGANGSVTKTKAAAVVKTNCNTGSATCAPTITQTLTITSKDGDKLVKSDSLISAGGVCRDVDEVISIPPHLYALMLKLDPLAPNDINKLSAWLAKMGQKYLKNAKAKALLAYLISELDKWLAQTVPGTCPEIQEEINAVLADDAQEELVAAQAAGAVPAAPGGTITITKNTDQATSDTFTFDINGPSASVETIPMGGQNSEMIVVTVEPGTYSIAEHELSGWSLNGSDCEDGPTDGVVVPAGGNVDCTFNNTATAGEASLTGLGDIPGGVFSSLAFDVSSDGSVVVGTGHGVAGQGAFRWTAGTGMVNLSPGVFSSSSATSSDGSVVVGVRDNTTSFQPHAFRWTSGTGLADLGTLPSSEPGSNSFALDVSADGNVVVGHSSYFPPGTTEAFRWTPTGGMVGLGFLAGTSLSVARAVSADGSVIVGFATGAGIAGEAFRWTSTGGMQGLGIMGATPNAVNSDGSVIVGGISATGGTDAFRWSQATGIEILPGLGGSFSEAHDISADGSVIVGTAASPNDNEAVIWRKVSGSWTVQTLEAAGGFTDSRLTTARGVSADGRTIVGDALTLFGVNTSEAYRAVLP